VIPIIYITCSIWDKIIFRIKILVQTQISSSSNSNNNNISRINNNSNISIKIKVVEIRIKVSKIQAHHKTIFLGTLHLIWIILISQVYLVKIYLPQIKLFLIRCFKNLLIFSLKIQQESQLQRVSFQSCLLLVGLT